ncbi:Cif family virulence factor [Arenibaculum pallidiluteum]|uniref:hypothetical protein n=1 Tax=Arenibaculum pallidiluteum TaxID=2812559 RepID=UPI001A95672C|nr:hypothetical protein [Arenibaculum pallidiluteum]
MKVAFDTSAPRAAALGALAVLAAGVASPAVAAGPACPAEGAASAGALHREWILVGWERQEGDGPFSFRDKLGKYYDWSSPEVILYDDFDPQHRITRSAAEYGAIWEPPFSAMRSARHGVVFGPEVIQEGGLAHSTLQFAARLEGGDGTVTGIRTLSSLAWRCTGEGWRIVREHNSSVVVPDGELQALMDRASRG